ncbi:MAG: DUF802 domain-containing protein [Rhodocyclaceae bacterium]
MNRIISLAAFLIGLAAVGWIGFGYIGSSLLALAMTALIGAVYLTGAAELRRFDRATGALAEALENIPEGLAHPADWLARLPPSLQNPVRLRIEGERVGLPGPALTPYLVGLLVLLGMLGTFLGMVVTLNGAVIALENTTDLQTIRASLAAPVKGLGVAFGTSVAGVAASAMLGLISALCRRTRLRSAQLLDTRIATTLRGFSLAHQRQETFKALQQQANTLPAVAEKLDAMVDRVERHSVQMNERMLAEQGRFYSDAREMYEALAASVGDALKHSLGESARLAGETIRPAVEATMSSIAHETTALQTRVAEQVQTQLDGLAGRFDSAVGNVSDTWTAALASHERSSEKLGRRLENTLASYADTFEQRSATLLASVEQAHGSLRAELASSTAEMAAQSNALHRGLADTVGAQLDGLSSRFATTVTGVADSWSTALSQHEATSQRLGAQLGESLQAFAETFDARSAALLATLADTAASLQAELAARDEARLAAHASALDAMAASLQQEWQQAGAQTLARQEQICATLGDTAREMAATAREQASTTIDEVTRLMNSAAEAPRAAAQVIGELRNALSASIARDNEMLTERSRIMETLGALLDAINHASTEQRSAIDALVSSSAALLEQAGSGFGERVDAESARMGALADQLGTGAVEVASLGEAFGFAVQRFSESNDSLMATLGRIEGALDKSLGRSDEQLAYYVAQAREIIDLSIMSQKQIVEDLQQLSGKPAALAGEV